MVSLHGVGEAPHGSASGSEVLIFGWFLSHLHKPDCAYPRVAEVLDKQTEHQGTCAGSVLL